MRSLSRDGMEPMRITKTVYKVGDFVSWQKAGSLILSPSFQRRPNWGNPAKSYLIDTVARGLPIPIVFIRERLDLGDVQPKREVVDGQQRLRTLIAFVDGTALPDFDAERDTFKVRRSHNRELAGKAFNELVRDLQEEILNYEMSVHILPSYTEDRDVLQIFARINSTGVKVNPQELRNAAWFGLFKSAMYALSYEQLDRWRRWGLFTENEIARMEEVELVSELVQLMLSGPSGHSQAALNRLYEDLDDNFPDETEVSRRLRAVLDVIDDLVGSDLSGLQFSRVTLFYTMFELLYDRMFGLRSPLERTSARPVPGSIGACLRRASSQISEGRLHPDLLKGLRGAGSHASVRAERLEYLRRACRV